MSAKMRLGAIVVLASGLFFSGAYVVWACHGNHSGRRTYAYPPVVVPSASQQPASLSAQAALVTRVQQTGNLLASSGAAESSSLNSPLAVLQQKQLAVQNSLQTALQRQNGRLTRQQLTSLGKRESAIIAQLHAMRGVAVK